MTNSQKPELKQLDLPSFFAELGSPVRLEILRLLAEGLEYRNSEMARKLELSAQESLRHLSRLIDTYLVVQSDREYTLSQVGRIFLEGILPQVNFLLQNYKFFQTHDFSVIPPILTRRFAELTLANVIENSSVILRKAETIIENAQEYIWDVAKLVTTNTTRLMASKQGLEIRAIEETRQNGGSSNSNDLDAVPKIIGQIRRAIDHIDIAVLLSEKEAYIRFPVVLTGELSLNHVLYGTDPSFLSFCRDLFNFYWEMATPVSDL